MADSLTIRCPTCRTRLKVRDASLAGQVLACPKCKCLVEVTLDGATFPDRAAECLSPSDVPRPSDKIASAQPVGPRAASGKGSPRRARVAVATRSWIIWLTSGGLGLLIGIAVWGTVPWRDPEGRAGGPLRQPPREGAQRIARQRDPEVDARRLPRGGSQPDGASGSAHPADAPDSAIVSSDQLPAGEIPLVEGDPLNEPPAEDGDSTGATAPTHSGGAEPPTDQTNRRKLPGDSSVDGSPPDDAPQQTNDALDRPTDSGEGRSAPSADGSDDTASDDAAQDTGDDPVDEAAPELEPIDAVARLADPIEQIEFRQTELRHVLRLLAQRSTLSISCDLEALARGGIALTHPVSARLGPASVEEVLRGVLEPLGLASTVVDGRLRITSAAALETAGRPAERMLAATAADEPARLAAAVGELLSASAGPLPAAAVRVTGNRLVLDLPPAAVALVDSLIARWPRGPAASAGQEIAPPVRRNQAAERFGRKLTAGYFAPTPLSTILAYLERQSGTVLALDTLALAEAGMRSGMPATLSIEEASLAEALDRLLGPLGLAWRVVDPQTIEVATPLALARRTELEVYPCGALADAAAFVAAARAELDRWSATAEGLPPAGKLPARAEPPAADAPAVHVGAMREQRWGGSYWDEGSQSLFVAADQATQTRLGEAWRRAPRRGTPR